jgi:nucleotide-binding universal stress UspA family protein
MYRHIVVALDGSPDAEKILPHVAALAKAFGSAVTLLGATESLEMVVAETVPTAVPPEPLLVVDPVPVVRQEHHDTAAYLETIAADLRERGISVGYRHPEGPAAEVILETAERLGADLIAMTTHGRGGIGRLVFGSVADDVLRNARCPLLLVRLDDEEEKAPSVPERSEALHEPTLAARG